MNKNPIWGNAAYVVFTSEEGDSWHWNLTRMIFKPRRRTQEIRLHFEDQREPRNILLSRKGQRCKCDLKTLQGDIFSFCGFVGRPAGLIEITGLIQHSSHGIS